MIQEKIKNILEKKFGIQNIKIYNENQYHKSHNPPLDHFKIIVISDAFIKKSLLMRHRYIYKICNYIKYGIHSMAIYTYTPDEWILLKNKKTIKTICLNKKTSLNINRLK